MGADLTEAIRIRTGSPDSELAGRALRAVVSLLGSALPDSDAEWLCREHAVTPAKGRVTCAAELYDAVSAWLAVPEGRAVEIADSVLAVISDSLPEELMMRMKKHLPPDITTHLVPRPDPQRVMHKALRSNFHDTIAEGRPGSQHPISEAKPYSTRRR